MTPRSPAAERLNLARGAHESLRSDDAVMTPDPVSASAALAATAICCLVAMVAVNTVRARETRKAEVYAGLRCIHRYEGAWDANTGNGYYGGLQMDRSFQRTYGGDIYRRLGTADRWPARTQLLVGYRGWRTRGFQPWPQTRRMCGL